MYLFWIEEFCAASALSSQDAQFLEDSIRADSVAKVESWLAALTLPHAHMAKVVLETTALHRGDMAFILSSSQEITSSIESTWEAVRHYLHHLAHYRTQSTKSLWGSWDALKHSLETAGYWQMAVLASIEGAWDACLRGRPRTCIEQLPSRSLSRQAWDLYTTRHELLARFTCYLLMGEYSLAKRFLQKLRDTELPSKGASQMLWKRLQLSFAADFEEHDVAEKIIESLPNSQGIAPFTEALILRHKAQIHTSRHENFAAASAAEEFEYLRDSMGLPKDFANIFQDRAELLLRSADMQKAGIIIADELSAATNVKHDYRLAFAHFYRAKWLLLNKEVNLAYSSFILCQRIVTQQSLSRLAAALHLLGWCIQMRTTREPIKARHELIAAITQARKSHLERTLKLCHYLLFVTEPAASVTYLNGFVSGSGTEKELAFLLNLAGFLPRFKVQEFRDGKCTTIYGEKNFREVTLLRQQHIWFVQEAALLAWKDTGNELVSFVNRPALASLCQQLFEHSESSMPELFSACFKLHYDASRHAARMHSLLNRLRKELQPHGFYIEYQAGKKIFAIVSNLPICVLKLDVETKKAPKKKSLEVQERILQHIKQLAQVETSALARELGCSRQFLFPYLTALEAEGRIIKRRSGRKTLIIYCED